MSNFGFGDIFQRVGRQVFDSALNAAANASARANNPFNVIEISSIDEVSRYPVLSRAGELVFYGPVNPHGFSSNKPAAFNIILHVPNSPKMFSLCRSENRVEAETAFILYKETLPLLVSCDPIICELEKLAKITKKLRENSGWKAPHIAAFMSFLSCLRHEKMKDKLNDQEDVLLRTPLLIAIDCDNLPVVIALLELGADPTIKDIKENSVFHLASQKSVGVFQTLRDKMPLRAVELLNHVNAEGYTPLHLACKNNKPELVKDLLSTGADAKIGSESQGFPIHIAVKASSISSVQELIRQNPEQLNMKDLQTGGSPLHWAEGVETLISLLDMGSDPNTTDDSGNAALHTAARRGCFRSTVYLLCHGAFPDWKGGEDEDTALHVASKLCSRSVMKTLIVFGADINITNKHGHTARHLVCTSQRSDKDQALFILTAVGAKRCHQAKANSCTEGCKFSGTFDGISPENFKDHKISNVLYEALNASSLQAGVRRSNSFDMNAETAGTSQNQNGVRSDFHIGGRLLCLDGGGIRGIVLTQMLDVIAREFECPIISMFDWIAGTSTGGILALALACGKSPLETQCIYMRLKDKVFVGERPYSAAKMEEFLKKEFGSEKRMSSIQTPRVMIMTALVDRRPADLHIFRNYLSPSVMMGMADMCSQDPESQFVWETAKITGAAPSYFRLDHPRLVDGGLIANNPTLDALTELQQFSTALTSTQNFPSGLHVPTVVVSLGTGIPPLTEANASHLDITWPSGVIDAITKVPRLASLVNLLVDQATQSEGQVVERSRAWCSSIGTPYFRFSPKMSTMIELDEKDDEKLINLLWETRSFMIANKDIIADMKKVLKENS